MMGRTSAFVVFFCLIILNLSAQSSDDLYAEERKLVAQLAGVPGQNINPQPSDRDLPYEEYFRFQKRLYKKIYSEAANGQVQVLESICTNETLETWEESKRFQESENKIRDYIAAERLKARIEIQNQRIQLLVQIDSLQKRQQLLLQKEIAAQPSTTTIYDEKGKTTGSVVTEPGSEHR